MSVRSCIVAFVVVAPVLNSRVTSVRPVPVGTAANDAPMSYDASAV